MIFVNFGVYICYYLSYFDLVRVFICVNVIEKGKYFK